MLKNQKYFELLLRSGIITDEMIGACIFSVNKRAKNYRDLIQNQIDGKNSGFYPGYPFFERNIEFCRKYKERYYEFKDFFLQFYNPVEIHIINGDYFLLFSIASYTFHSPSTIEEIQKKYPNLNQINIENFHTEGEPVKNLATMQFVRKVRNFIEN